MKMRWYQHSTQGGRLMTSLKNSAPSVAPPATSQAAKGSSQAVSADGKTKALKDRFAKLELANALIIDGADLEPKFARAARNIPNIDLLPVQGINVYDILRRRKLVLTKAAVAALEARFK